MSNLNKKSQARDGLFSRLQSGRSSNPPRAYDIVIPITTEHSSEENVVGDQSSQLEDPNPGPVHSMKVNEERVYLTKDEYCETLGENVEPIPTTATNIGGPKGPAAAATPRCQEPKEASPTATDTTATDTTATDTTATDTNQAGNRSKRSLFHTLRTKG